MSDRPKFVPKLQPSDIVSEHQESWERSLLGLEAGYNSRCSGIQLLEQ